MSSAEREQFAGESRKIVSKREQSPALSETLPSMRKSGGQVRAVDKLAWTMPNGSHLHEVNLRNEGVKKIKKPDAYG